MKVEFQSPKTVITFTAKPDFGCFALDDKELLWVKCREQFANYFTSRVLGFYFSHKHDCADNVAQFISKTEEIIGIKDCATYAKTNRNWVLWIEPNAFWTSCAMRRSLFTILLRCGLNYKSNEDNYEESLYSEGYIKETKEAVMRFLFGFTKYVPDNSLNVPRGWVSAFKNADRDLVRRQLLSSENEQSTIGINSLWA